jgi:hypothetical protein
MTRTAAFWHLLEAGCATVEQQQTLSAALPTSDNMISKISDISFNLPGYGFPEDEEMPTPRRNGALQVAATQQGATLAPAAVKTAPAKRIGSLPQHIQVIAEARAQYDKLSLAEFSQLLYERNIYRAKDRKTGEEKPVNRGTLLHWLEKAHEEGLH